MNKQTIRRVLTYIRPRSGLALLSLLLNLGTVILTLLTPILIGRGIDCIIGPEQVDFAKLADLLLKVGLCVGASALLQWLTGLLNNRLTYCTVQDIRRDAFRHIQQLPLKYLDSHPSGDLVSRMITDVDSFADGLLMGFTQLFSGVMTIIGTLVFMLTLSPLITVVVIVLTPVSLLVGPHNPMRCHFQPELKPERLLARGHPLNPVKKRRKDSDVKIIVTPVYGTDRPMNEAIGSAVVDSYRREEEKEQITA